MKYLNNISTYFNIDEIYITLVIKTTIYLFLIYLIQLIGIKLLKKTKDNKKEYLYTQKFKLIINIIKVCILFLFWGKYIKTILTFISVISAAFTIALRDLVFNFFSGLYIKIAKPFEIEDRIQIEEYKGDVINIKSMNFEILEVNNVDFKGQSTGIIIHLPNSIIFKSPLKNFNKGFKYIWDEINVNVPLESDLKKAKSTIYKIVNSNDIIKNIPPKMKNQINNISNNYRIYYNKYEPIIYTKIVEDHIELQIRYLVHPKKARYVESTIWNNIIKSYKKKEIELYK